MDWECVISRQVLLGIVEVLWLFVKETPNIRD